MQRINVQRFGIAFGLTAALFYLACVIIMAVLPHGANVRLFNTMMHGMDMNAMARFDVPILESILGIALYFILGWIAGALVAGIYNALGQSEQRVDAGE